MRTFAGDEALPDAVSRLRQAGCVFPEEEAQLLVDAVASARELDSLLARRVAGEPLENVLGWAQFGGLRVGVARGVFIPRRRSEFLAAAAIDAALDIDGPVVLELCCGAGAVSAAVAAAVPTVRLHAADLLPAAVDCARKNLGGRATVYRGDLFAPLPDALHGRIDVVVANAPYVPTDRLELMPREARQYEPAEALDGGPDGLAVLGRIAADAPRWLRPGGSLFVECSEGQVPDLAAAFTTAGLPPTVLRDAEADATVLRGTMPRR